MIVWQFDIYIHMLHVCRHTLYADRYRYTYLQILYYRSVYTNNLPLNRDKDRGRPYLRLTTQVFGNTVVGSEVSRKCYGRFALYFDFLPLLCRCGKFRFVFELVIPKITLYNQCYDILSCKV